MIYIKIFTDLISMDLYKRFLCNLRFNTRSKFLFFGFLNFLITQIILGINLLLMPVYIATFISMTINVIIGYFVYSKFVFNYENRYSSKIFSLYILYAILIWLINWFTINFFYLTFNINKNITAILILPFLVIFSYLVQKLIIFRKVD